MRSASNGSSSPGRQWRGRRWPSGWASSRQVYAYLVLACTLAAIVALRHVIYAPFGYALRAARDSAARATRFGLDVLKLRWIGFTLAGGAAGLAGGSTPSRKARSIPP